MRLRRDQARWRRLLRVRLRRTLSRFDRRSPVWLGWLPSWGTSLLLHAVVLVILATAFFISERSPRERSEFDSAIISLANEDMQSLVPADQAGDPFSSLPSDATPSLSLGPTDARTVAQPLSTASFGPKLNMPDRLVARSEIGASDLTRSVRMHAEDMTAPFSGRSEASRAQILRREGGTPASEKAVQNGLYWLSRHQRDDGGWSLDTQGECRQNPGCPEGPHMESATAATGLALLPFLGAGHIHTQPGKYQETIRKGLDWLIARQQKTGELYLGGEFNAQMYSHAIATMALCEAYGLSQDPRLKLPAQLAIRFIVQSQNKEDGGWRYSPGMPGDTSVLGWQMFALRSARLAGLDVPKNVIRGCAHFLDQVSADKYRTRYAYLPGRLDTPVMSAEGLLCRQYLGWLRESPAMVKGAAGVWDELRSLDERNIYYWYYATQLLHNMQNKAWKQWNPKIRDGLVATQVTGDGCDRGSWSPFDPVPDRWGRRAGRLFETSLSILTLEVYYRFLPLYRTDAPIDADPARSEKPDQPAQPERAVLVP